MTASERSIFDELLEHLGDQPDVERLQQIRRELDDAGVVSAERLIERYQAAADIVERMLWQAGCPDVLLALYQRLYREMEARLAVVGPDRRFGFIVVIPVADRPQQLQNCLDSLLSLCRCFAYGGVTNRGYVKISVLIADDSRYPVNVGRHQQLAEDFTRRGLRVRYFGQEEQLRQLERLSRQTRQALRRILGDLDPQAFFHKGASITRNLAYLQLAEAARVDRQQLFWFIDSDQEFCVSAPVRERPVYAINYFQRLERIFSGGEIQVLTGKVVGDPPVSPAVMAGNFLDDVISFLAEMVDLDPRQGCTFHQQTRQVTDQAAYHDMAELFGFEPATPARYRCSLSGVHDHAQCFADFAARLSRFFDGEHPTRQTCYAHQAFHAGIQPARTVYTGNYVLTAEALQYFIPFATLKLRMAGPVLGRILQSGLGRHFVSANLPLLHKRTLDELGQSEFRAGIDRDDLRDDLRVDLSGEFERQFYGDVMLFTIERLSRQGYPFEPLAEVTMEEVLIEVEALLRQKYAAKHNQIRARLGVLQDLLTGSQPWWNQDPAYDPTRRDLMRFIRNMEYNFGADSPAYRMIHAAGHRRRRHQEILTAIGRLPQDRSDWVHALGLGQ